MNSLKFTGRGSEADVPARNVFCRMKEKAAILALAAVVSCGTQHGPVTGPVETGAQGGEESAHEMPASGKSSFKPEFRLPEGDPPFDFGPAANPVPRERCTVFQEIDHWAKRRELDRQLVRAFVMTESGFDPLAARKACSRDAILSGAVPGCLPAGPDGNSEGYHHGFEEMHDPSGSFSLDSAPNASSSAPGWRWLYFGLMQTVEPPYTYWPASYSSDGTDGKYLDVFSRSRLFGIPLDEARNCSPEFNPFNPADSVCLGTRKMELMMKIARHWVATHRSELGWAPVDPKGEIFAAYVAGNMYSGVWDSTSRAPDHPRCSSSMANWDCWAFGFSLSRGVDGKYCRSPDGKQDTVRCERGRPKVGPDRSRPQDCYGMMDFVQYVRNCELPFLPRQHDPGAEKMRAFYSIRNSCGP